MKAESLIALLQTEVSRLRKLKGEDVAFFFVMAPGAENPSTQLFSGSEQGPDQFYRFLMESVSKAQKTAEINSPYITAVGMGRGR